QKLPHRKRRYSILARNCHIAREDAVSWPETATSQEKMQYLGQKLPHRKRRYSILARNCHIAREDAVSQSETATSQEKMQYPIFQLANPEG
ncbi:hypothetical protein QP860_08395, partial [Aerococcus sp. UMB1112A]|uniref:hypothetical protein n=1 Tax=Aerococcus sp. UMB1112A TaxID=3050609 RepID=UPI00254B27DF